MAGGMNPSLCINSQVAGWQSCSYFQPSSFKVRIAFSSEFHTGRGGGGGGAGGGGCGVFTLPARDGGMMEMEMEMEGKRSPGCLSVQRGINQRSRHSAGFDSPVQQGVKETANTRAFDWFMSPPDLQSPFPVH